MTISSIIPEENIKFVLERMRFEVRRTVPIEELRYMKAAKDMDWKNNLMHFQLRWMVPGRRESIDIPASWWQHFKQDRFPPWLKRRFPVKTNTIHATQLFPDINMDLGRTNEYIQGFGALL